MKNFLMLICLFLCANLMAVDPSSSLESKFDLGFDQLTTELQDLNEVNAIILENDYDYNQLAAAHPNMVNDLNLSSEAADGIFDGHPDNPLGIPGFWWGFCLGLIGLIVILVSMDKGADRKEQMMNAIWGCVISSLVSIALQVLVIAA